MMHPFKKSACETDREYRATFDDMLALSQRICRAAGLSASDVEIAEKHSLMYEAGDYLLEPRHACLLGGGCP